MMLLIETGVVLVFTLTAIWSPAFGVRPFQWCEGLIARISRHRRSAVVIVGFAALSARLIMLPFIPIPVPGIPDEFGYLLSGDTLAHLRLSMPPHPMWVHFENLSVIQQPSYASKYFPGQGLFLAIGQVFFGHPFWGVCISVALMCAAICWMLQGWVSETWAFAGGILAVIRLAMFSYWANSYWGGAVAATGGAFVLGAIPRINRRRTIRDPLLMGLGLVILVFSRPYEGALLTLLCVLVVAFSWIRKDGRRLVEALFRVILPIGLSLIVAAIAMAYYCRTVTGNIWQTPYQVAQDTYYPTPIFLWQPLRTMPKYRQPVLQSDIENWDLPLYESSRRHPVVSSVAKLLHFWLFFLDPALTAPFIILLFILPFGFKWGDLSSDCQLLLLALAVPLAGMMLPLRFNPGYAAPLTGVVYVLVVKAIKGIRSKATKGIDLARAVAMAVIVMLGIRSAAGMLRIPLSGARTWCSQDFQLTDRAKLERMLEEAGGRHLILVRYPEPDPGAITFWISNPADIDDSPVVWAHDMGVQKNTELIHYFKDRKVWVLQAGTLPPKLSAYTTEPTTNLLGNEVR